MAVGAPDLVSGAYRPLEREVPRFLDPHPFGSQSSEIAPTLMWEPLSVRWTSMPARMRSRNSDT